MFVSQYFLTNVYVGPPVLELISVHRRIVMLQRLIGIHNEKTTANNAGEPL